MSISRFIVGIFFMVLGIFLIVLSFTKGWIILAYGIPCLVLGFIIFLNKKEDFIEQRKDLNKLKVKK